MARIDSVGWIYAVLLAGALAALVLAEWPRLSARLGVDVRPGRSRKLTRAHLRLVPEEESEAEEFAASVERDLSKLPTIEKRNGKSRRSR